MACLVMGLPLAYVLARTQTRFKNILIILVVLPLFVGNAVRAAGWMTVLGNKGFLNVMLMDLGIVDAPLQMMYTEGGRHRGHHRGEPPLYGADAAERHRRHQPCARGGCLQPGCGPLRDDEARAAAAGPAGPAGRNDPDLHPRDERLCHAGASRRAEIQDDGAARLRAVPAPTTGRSGPRPPSC